MLRTVLATLPHLRSTVVPLDSRPHLKKFMAVQTHFEALQEKHPKMFGGAFRWAKLDAEHFRFPTGAKGIFVNAFLCEERDILQNYACVKNPLFRSGNVFEIDTNLLPRLDGLSLSCFYALFNNLGFDPASAAVIDSFLGIPVAEDNSFSVKGYFEFKDLKKGQWLIASMLPGKHPLRPGEPAVIFDYTENGISYVDLSIFFDGPPVSSYNPFIRGFSFSPKIAGRPGPVKHDDITIIAVPVKQHDAPLTDLVTDEPYGFSLSDNGGLYFIREKLPLAPDLGRQPVFCHASTFGVTETTTGNEIERAIHSILRER